MSEQKKVPTVAKMTLRQWYVGQLITGKAMHDYKEHALIREAFQLADAMIRYDQANPPL